MSTLSRKQREIQEREERILEVAQEQLVQDGYHGLNMDKIAATLEYAKGTIYNHFPCKEEIMVALAVRVLEQRTEMFRHAAAWQGNSRQRLAAIGAAAEVFVQQYPHLFQLERLIGSASIWEKISETRKMQMQTSEQRCIEIIAGIVRDGVAANDLQLPAEMKPEHIVFGLWSMTLGAYSIIARNASLSELGIEEPYIAVRRQINATMDGLGWKPLLSEFDYVAYTDECARELFTEQALA